MNIRKIVLYGFGQHENLTLDLQSGMNVLYGPNEAGKTTIQQAILHILFGFPQKNQQELRYEPKTGGKYGGCLFIEDALFGPWKIERVRGKSSGDVIIHFEDGRTAGEEELQRLLRGYDRAAFEAIFSFSLFQLQGLDKLDEQDISRTLLASGTTGLDTLWKVEKKMDKEMASLFKKAGRNPLINQKLKELKELESVIQKEQKKLATYEPLNVLKSQVDERVDALRLEEHRLHERAEQQRVATHVLPLQQQQRKIQEQLSDLSNANFPADGIRRFEELASKQSELQLKRERILLDLQENAEQVNMRPVEEQQQIERWIAQEAQWHRLRTDIGSAQQELHTLEKKRQQSKQRLGLTDAQQESIEQLDLSVARERQLQPLLEEQATSEQQLHTLNRMVAEIESERQEAEQRKKMLAQQQLSEADLQKVERFPEAKKAFDEAKARVSATKQSSRSVGLLLFVVIGLVVSAYSVWQQQWGLLVIGLLVVLGLLWKRQPSDVTQQQAYIRTHEATIREMENLQERMIQLQRKSEQLEVEIHKLDRKSQQLAAEMEQVHEKKRRVEEALRQSIQEDPFDSTSTIQENFRLLRDYQDQLAEQQMWKHRLEEGQHQLRTHIEQVEKVLGPVSEDVLYEKLRHEWMIQKECKEKDKNRQKLREQLVSQLKEVDMYAISVAQEIEELFRLTNVTDKESYYATYQQQQEAYLLKRQLAEVDAQLALYTNEPFKVDFTLPQLERQKAKTAERLQVIRKEIIANVDEQVRVNHELAQMSESQTYSELQQVFEVKKAELEELAKQWIIRKAVMESIRQTMSEWKEHQLPAVLKLANQWFSRLTANRYSALALTSEGYFQAVTTSGQSFMINELSQATKEQAYLSLRLALASELSDRAPFPILMDDPFVHFDNERLSRMIEILKELQPAHQFLYFTCHASMQSKWSGEAAILDVRKQ